MHTCLRCFAGNGNRAMSRRGDLVVSGDRKFQDHERALRPDPQEVSGVIARGFLTADADFHRDARGPQPRVPLSADFGIGILNSGDHPRDARRVLDALVVSAEEGVAT